MKNYEVTFIVDPVLSSENIKDAASKYVSLLNKRGAIVNVDELGLRELIYPIKKRKTGVYYCVEFESPNDDLVGELELKMRRDESIMRFLTIKLDKYGVKYNDDKRSGLIGKRKTTKRNKNKSEVAITIDGIYEEFDNNEKNKLIAYLREALKTEKEIEVLKIEKGSIQVTLLMDDEDAENLFILIKAGALNDYGIKKVKLSAAKGLEKNWEVKEDSISINYNNLSAIKKKLKSTILTYGLDKCLKQLNEITKDNSQFKNELISILASINRLSKNSRINIYNPLETDRLINNLTFSTLELIDRFEESDIKPLSEVNLFLK